MCENETQIQAEKIRAQYEEKQITDLDRLKALDAEVKRPAETFAYTYGPLSALVMGAGMSLVMTSRSKALRAVGVALGTLGMGMAVSTAPIHNKILARRRKEYAPQIIELSENITKG